MAKKSPPIPRGKYVPPKQVKKNVPKSIKPKDSLRKGITKCMYNCPSCLVTFNSKASIIKHITQSTQCMDILGQMKGYDGITKLNPNNLLQNSQIIDFATEQMQMETYESEDDIVVVDDDDTSVDTRSTTIQPFDFENVNSATYYPQAVDSRLTFVFTTSDYIETQLLQILNNANVPHYLYEQIMNWTRAAHNAKYNFQPKRLKRKQQISYLEQWLGLQGYRPQLVPIILPGKGEEVHVTKFDFATQLLSLLQNQKLVSDCDNLDVNRDQPFGDFSRHTNVLGCVNSGRWYKRAHQHCCKEPNDFLVPLIFAYDETTVQRTNRKVTATPLLFTTSIFSQALRNTKTVWRPLGFVYNLGNIESKAQAKAASRENHLKNERYQALFQPLLADLINIQKGVDTSLNNIQLSIGGITKTVNIKVPVAFIIGDMVGGDKLCCKSPNYSNKTNRLCRKCNIHGNESADPFVECRNISQQKVIELLENKRYDQLDKINQYHVFPA